MPVEIEVVKPIASPEDAYSHATWRVVTQPPGDGALNMAIDEAALEAVAAGEAAPTLRFYGWDPACLSLGQAQPIADVDRARLAERGWGLVRRITGGRAILHTDELTYSVIVRKDDPRVAGGVVESYRRLSRGLLAGLNALGAAAATVVATDTGPVGATGHASHDTGPVCFEVPSDYEITAYGKKLLGSAQTRRKGVVLQHGALPLTGDLGRICDVLVFESEAAREAAKRRVLARATTLADVMEEPVSMEAAARAMMAGFAAALNLTLEEGPLSEAEMARAEQLRVEKYAAEGWTAAR